jgi:signal transduction histidine kinase
MITIKKNTGRWITLLTFIIINLYAGLRLFYQFKEFKQFYMTVPITIESMKEQTYLPWLADALEVDDDGEDEIVYSCLLSPPQQQAISVFERMSDDYKTEYYGDILASLDYIFFDIYYNPELETYVFRFLDVENGRLVLREVDNRMNPVKNLDFEKLKKSFAVPGNWFKKAFLVDLDPAPREKGDEKKELILILHSEYPQDPRGVVCFDPETGKLLWEYYSGTMIEEVEFFDLDRDGKKEIILTSFAANDDIEENGTSDRFSYVIVLDSNGKEQWHRKVGDWHTYSHAVASDLEDDGTFEIIAVAQCSRKRSEGPYGKIFCFKGITVEKEEKYPIPGVSFSKPFVLKSAKTGTRIYVGDTKGHLWVLDRNFNPLNEIRRDAPLNVLNKTVLSPSENWEYIYVRANNHLLVFARDLDNEIFNRKFNVDTPIEMIPLKSKQGHYALIKADKLYLLKESKVSINLKALVRYGVKSGLFVTIFILVLFNGFIVYRRVRTGAPLFPFGRKRDTDSVGVSQPYDLVQAIAHQVKTPISTILWTAEKIKRDSEKFAETGTRETYSHLADVLTADVKTLKKQTGHLAKLVRVYNPVFKETALKPFLEHVTGHYRTLVDEDKKIDIQLEVKGLTVSIDEELFKEALVNIMDHAVDAMPAGGKLIISAAPVRSPLRSKGRRKNVLIEMEYTDKGYGSEPEKGNNIGLSICLLVIEAHGGNIEFHRRKGSGTRISITIPSMRLSVGHHFRF